MRVTHVLCEGRSEGDDESDVCAVADDDGDTRAVLEGKSDGEDESEARTLLEGRGEGDDESDVCAVADDDGDTRAVADNRGVREDESDATIVREALECALAVKDERAVREAAQVWLPLAERVLRGDGEATVAEIQLTMNPPGPAPL